MTKSERNRAELVDNIAKHLPLHHLEVDRAVGAVESTGVPLPEALKIVADGIITGDGRFLYGAEKAAYVKRTYYEEHDMANEKVVEKMQVAINLLKQVREAVWAAEEEARATPGCSTCYFFGLRYDIGQLRQQMGYVKSELEGEKQC